MAPQSAAGSTLYEIGELLAGSWSSTQGCVQGWGLLAWLWRGLESVLARSLVLVWATPSGAVGAGGGNRVTVCME